jgi:CO dehydrogenase nickel-insertion accessory protein CooC1
MAPDGKTVLVVDNDPEVRELVEGFGRSGATAINAVGQVVEEIRKRRLAAREQTKEWVSKAQALARKFHQDCARLEQLHAKT